jgi:hypothetical protein
MRASRLINAIPKCPTSPSFLSGVKGDRYACKSDSGTNLDYSDDLTGADLKCLLQDQWVEAKEAFESIISVVQSQVSVTGRDQLVINMLLERSNSDTPRRVTKPPLKTKASKRQRALPA